MLADQPFMPAWFIKTCLILLTVISISVSPHISANSVLGGQMILNLNRDALAGAFTHNTSERPAFYLEEYFDPAQAAGLTSAQILTDHIIPGTAEVNATGLQFSINGSTATAPNQVNNFTFNPGNLVGTASGKIGLGGAMRFRLDVPFRINSETNEEEGNRAIAAYLSLEYDSGWTIYNHHSFRAPVFDLVNVITTENDDILSMSGDMALGSGFGHMGGQVAAIIGDFSFTTTVVPIPAAMWLFASALSGLFFTRRIKGNVTT